MSRPEIKPHNNSVIAVCPTAFALRPTRPTNPLTANRTSTSPSQCFHEPVRVTDIASLTHYRSHRVPFYGCTVSAGFPSPADDHLDGHINLNEHLIPHPSATFLVRANGWSMVGEGIHHEDLLIVDRSETPRHGKIVVAAINGELTVKKLCRQGERAFLEAANPDYPAIELLESDEVWVWGTVIHVIHSV